MKDIVVVLVGLSDAQVKMFRNDEYQDCNIVPIRRTQNQQELAMLYSLADVCLSLSKFETFGLTIVEAMACGTPAVVYDNTAPPSLITPETGIVVENGNWKAAYNALLQIKLKSKQYYSDTCVTLAREKYDKDKCFEKYVELYEDLLRN